MKKTVILNVIKLYIYSCGGEFMIDICKDNDFNVIIPSGDIVSNMSNLFRKKMIDLLNEGNNKLRFDFSKVLNLDSQTLYVFALIPENNKENKELSLEIININSDIANLFKYTHLDKIYKLIEVKKKIV